MINKTPSTVKRYLAVYLLSGTVFLIAGFHCRSVYAKPLMEKKERFEIDWGALRIRFQGQAESLGPSEPLVAVEKRAWEKGLVGFRDEFAKHYSAHRQDCGDSVEDAKGRGLEVSTSLTRSTYSYRHEYFQNGEVKIYMESSLSRAIAAALPPSSNLEESGESRGARSSGLVIRLPNNAKPAAIYEITDEENGALLFDVKNVSRSAFEKRAMGSWFVQASPKELRRAVGPSPTELVVKLGGRPYQYVCTSENWQKATKGNRSVLSDAKIALVLQQPTDPALL